MSVELEEAKVQVAAFQKQCEEFLVVIVQQKREADEQQKVCNPPYKYSFKFNFMLDFSAVALCAVFVYLVNRSKGKEPIAK